MTDKELFLKVVSDYIDFAQIKVPYEFNEQVLQKCVYLFYKIADDLETYDTFYQDSWERVMRNESV